MIQSQTIFRVCDNSGAKKVKCIKVLGGFKRKFACVGDLVVGSIQYVKQHKKKKLRVKEGEVVRALIVKSCSKTARKNFSRFSCKENSVVLMMNSSKPVATRVLGSVPKELRNSKFLRVATISSGFF